MAYSECDLGGDAIWAPHVSAQRFTFWDGAALNRGILAPVRSVAKTVCSDAAVGLFAHEDAVPQVGCKDIAIYWFDAPPLTERIDEVTQTPFDKMTEDFVPPLGVLRDLMLWRTEDEVFATRASSFALKVLMLVERLKMVKYFRVQVADHIYD